MTNRFKFLKAVVGDEGAKALLKALKNQELADVLLPRTILSWLEVVSCKGFDNNIPGLNDSSFTLKKTETGFAGEVVYKKGQITTPYAFKDANLYHVAGAIAVALDLDRDKVRTDLHGQSLVKLGKNLDLLVKSRTLNEVLKEKSSESSESSEESKSELKKKAPSAPKMGDVAKPMGAMPPVQPTLTQPKSAKPKANKTIKVKKSESNILCEMCGRSQFKNDKFVGCICLSSLAKVTKTEVINEEYVVKLPQSWGLDEVQTVIEALRKK